MSGNFAIVSIVLTSITIIQVDAAPLNPSTLLMKSTTATIVGPTIATVPPIQILSNCQPGQYFKRDCKLYISCDNGKWRRNFCPTNLFWNHFAKKCDQIHNVPECYEMYLQIKRNVRTLMATHTSLTSSKQPDIPSGTSATTIPTTVQLFSKTVQPITTSTTTATTTTTVLPSTVSDYDDSDSDYEQQPEEPVSTLVNSREQRHNKQPFVEEKRYFTSKDYEDYDDDDEDDADTDLEDQKAMVATTESTSNKQAKRSHHLDDTSKNDIITEKEVEELRPKLAKSKSITSSSSSSSPSSPSSSSVLMAANTYGKICIVRGKIMECHDVSTTTTSSTTTAASTTTLPPPTEDTKCKTSFNHPLVDGGGPIIHSYSFKIEINIDDNLFKRLESTIRLIFYYVSLQFIWN